jgi:hypothetical protein
METKKIAAALAGTATVIAISYYADLTDQGLLYRFQTFLVGFAAVLVGWKTIATTERQIAENRRLSQEEIAAARADVADRDRRDAIRRGKIVDGAIERVLYATFNLVQAANRLKGWCHERGVMSPAPAPLRRDAQHCAQSLESTMDWAITITTGFEEQKTIVFQDLVLEMSQDMGIPIGICAVAEEAGETWKSLDARCEDCMSTFSEYRRRLAEIRKTGSDTMAEVRAEGFRIDDERRKAADQ